MDEYDEPTYLDSENWPDDEVIEEFICELNSDPDGILTIDLIKRWYW